ncbi:MAG: YciI family protein [Gaiellaceae bacterium]
MKYALLIYGGIDWDTLSEAEQRSMYQEYMDISGAASTYGGAELHEAEVTTTVRVRNGDVLTADGPFAETKEVLGGLFLVDVANLDDAIAVAARIPAAREGAIEVRPVMER